MNIHEMDFRYSWISSIFQALEIGFLSVERRGEEEEWFDGLWQLEHAESLFGIAFVSAQTYILGTVQDVNKIREYAGKPSLEKVKYYNDDIKLSGNGVSRIALINSVANYYKHHDEWDSWPVNTTTKVLADVGITRQTEFPCYKAATVLWGQKKCQELGNLLCIISEWRESTLKKYK
jgi:hypothetical protein